MVSLVQHAAETTDNSGTATITLGSPTTAGDRLVLVCGTISADEPITGITLGGSADNWVQDFEVQNTGGLSPSILTVWSDPGCAGGQTSIVVTFAGTTYSMVDAYEVSGLAGGAPHQISDNITSSGSKTFTSNATSETGAADEFWAGGVIAVVTTSGNPTITGPGSPWTSEDEQQVGSHTSWLSGYQITSAEGEAAWSGSFSSASTYAAVVITYESASIPQTAAVSLAVATHRTAIIISNAGWRGAGHSR